MVMEIAEPLPPAFLKDLLEIEAPYFVCLDKIEKCADPSISCVRAGHSKNGM
jgi:hypothetical protein